MTAAPQLQAPGRERPILFSGPMVMAILEGRKTQTRRVVKWPEWLPPAQYPDAVHGFSSGLPRCGLFEDGRPVKSFGCPYGQPGDRLWVRETWFADPPNDGTWSYVQWSGCRDSKLSDIPERHRGPESCIYRATWAGADDALAWRPSIHMPRWASRLTLELTDVRVQRLKDISEEDAIAEGCPGVECYRNPAFTKLVTDTGVLPQEEFGDVWRSVYGDESWDANPWVWCVSFRRVTP